MRCGQDRGRRIGKAALGDIKRAEPKDTLPVLERTSVSVGSGVGEEAEVCLRGAEARSLRLCVQWDLAKSPQGLDPDGRTLGEKGVELLVCGPCREALWRRGVG